MIGIRKECETSSENYIKKPSEEMTRESLLMKSVGKPYEGKLHVRFDEGEEFN